MVSELGFEQGFQVSFLIRSLSELESSQRFQELSKMEL